MNFPVGCPLLDHRSVRANCATTILPELRGLKTDNFVPRLRIKP